MRLTLLEAIECNLKKLPKTDYGTPTVPDKPQPVWLRRQIGAIVTRRGELDDAKKKLAELEKAAASKGDEQAKIDVACQKIRVKSAEARLEFSTTKWKMLIAQVKKVYDPVTQAHKDAMVFGGQIASDADYHLANHNDPNAKIAPIPDLKFDQKKGLLKGDGTEFEIPSAGEGEIPTAEPIKPPPPPAPPPAPVGIADADKVKLKAKITALLKTYGMAPPPEKLTDAMKSMGLDPQGKDVLTQAGEVFHAAKEALEKSDATMSDTEKKAVATYAAELYAQSGVSSTAVGYANTALALQDAVLKAKGFLPDIPAALAAVKAAQDDLKNKAKEFNQLTDKEKIGIQHEAKQMAISGSMAGLGPEQVKAKLATNLTQTWGISAACAALFAAGAQTHVNKSWADVPADQKELLKAAVKKGATQGKTAYLSVVDANIVGLTKQGLADLIQAATGETEPDEAGFVQHVVKTFTDYATTSAMSVLPIHWSEVPGEYQKITGDPFVAAMSHYHLTGASLPASASNAILNAITALIKKLAKTEAFKKTIFDNWDHMVQTGTGAGMKVALINDAYKNIKAGYYAYLGLAKDEVVKLVYGEPSIKVLGNLYDEWYANWKKNNAAALPPPKLEDVTKELLSDPDFDPHDLSDTMMHKLDAAASKLGMTLGQLADHLLGEADAPTAVAPAPSPVTSAPEPIPSPKTTKFKKISKKEHLTKEQADWLHQQFEVGIVAGHVFTAAGKVKAQLGGYAAVAGQAFKSYWADAGVTGIGKDLLIEMLKEDIEKAMAEGLGPDKELKAKYLALKTSGAIAKLPHWKAAKIHSIYESAYVHALYVGKKKTGGISPASVFASAGQMAYFKGLLREAVAAGGTPTPVAPTPASQPVVTTPAAVDATTVATASASSLLGMNAADLANFVDPHKAPPSAPARPEWGSWNGVTPSGANGSHAAQWSGADAGGSIASGAKATHRWLHKMNAGFTAIGEVAAYRAQALLGGSNETCWLESGPGGGIGMTSFFADAKDIRTIENSGAMVYPWKKGYASEQTIRDLQQAHLINWLLDEHDDHGGNFMFNPETGGLRAIDHGQAAKFFDSSATMLSDFDWKVPKGAGFQDTGKGVPRKMLAAFAAGESVAVVPLTHPQMMDTILRAINIPDDVWDKLWRPYAEAAKAAGLLGKFSTVKSDKTVDGFLKAMIARKNNLAKEVEKVYTQVAATRAAALTAQGTPTTAKEVEETLGLPEFRELLKTGFSTAKPDKKVVAAAADVPTDWDDPKLPQYSRVPSTETLKKYGIVGMEFAVPSDDIKDGRVEMIDLGGGHVTANFWLEPGARAALQARLGWGGVGMTDSPPAKPDEPALPAFTPPPPPAGLKTAAQLHKEFMESQSVSSFTPAGATEPMTKLGKYVDKWAKGIAGGSNGEKYLTGAYAAAKAMAQSANAMEKAAGQHYMAEIERLGDVTTASGNFSWKPLNAVPAPHFIQPFVATKELEAAAKSGLEKEAAAYDAKVAEAKKAHGAAVEQLKKQHADALVKWEQQVAAYHAKKPSELKFTMLKSHQVPKPQLTSAATGGSMDELLKGGQYSVEASWDGKTVKEPVPQGGQAISETYKIDLGGGLTVHYVPGVTSGHRQNVGVAGTVRIDFPKDATHEQRIEGMKQVAATLGINLRPATAKEQELSYLRRMAWLRNVEGHAPPEAKAVEPAGTVEDRVNYWLAKFSEPPTKVAASRQTGGFGHDPRFLKDGKTPNPLYQPEAVDIGGRLAFRRWDITDAQLDEMVKKNQFLLHQGGAGGVSSSLRTGAIFSTEARYAQRGIFISGQSSGADRKHGGSYEVYLRNTFSLPSFSAESTLAISPRLLAYTGWYSVSGEAWGSKLAQAGSNNPTRKAMSLVERRLMEMISQQHGGETTAGPKLDLTRWLASYKAPSKAARDALVKGYKARGIHEIDGKKVEDVFTY